MNHKFADLSICVISVHLRESAANLILRFTTNGNATYATHIDENLPNALLCKLLSRGAAAISINPVNRFRRGLGERGRLRKTAEVVNACG